MGNTTSVADILDDWQLLLTAVREDADLLPNVEPHRAALEQAYNDVVTARTRRDLHKAGKQQATQDLQALIAKGKEQAMRLRGAVKGDMGPRSERLVHYKMAPLRRRTRKTKPAPDAPAPDPSPTPPTPSSTGSLVSPFGPVKDLM